MKLGRLLAFALAATAVQIIVDILLEYPPHTIWRRDIPVILSVVPPEWGVELRIVRLSGASSFPHVAYHFRYDHKLTIKSRGRTTENVLLHIYMALAACALGIRYQHGRSFSARDSDRLEHIAGPLVEQVLPLLARLKVPLARRSRS